MGLISRVQVFPDLNLELELSNEMLLMGSSATSTHEVVNLLFFVSLATVSQVEH
jgi:hypothetical protein